MQFTQAARAREGSEKDQIYESMKCPNLILMKVDMTEQSNQEKSFVVGGFASHRWRLSPPVVQKNEQSPTLSAARKIRQRVTIQS